jgi:hypothetical protein
VALDYFEPPYQNQKKSLLAGAEAEFQTATIILLKQVRLETYQVTGEKELIVETPSCTFDLTRHMAFSNGPIKAQTGTGDLRVEGVGFSWRQTQTNKIHTVIKRPLAASVPVQP